MLFLLPFICYHKTIERNIKGGDAMGDRFDDRGDSSFIVLENKAAQIRKLLLGSLLLAKDTWKEELLRSPRGLDVMKTMEEAEEEFIKTELDHPLEKLDNALSVINTRARAFVVLIDYLSQLKQ